MQNRTVVYNPKDHYRYSSFSQCNGTLGFDCFFRPLSSCQLTPEEIDYSNPKYKKAPHRPRAKRAVPESVVRIFSKTSAHPDSYYFLWRIQATFFMVQFNDKLKKWINEFKPKYIVNPKDRYDASVFIRRGHKYLEMKLVSSDKYRYPLEILRKLKSDGNNKKLSVFVNSDDPEALNEFLKFSDIYDISYYNCTRPKGGHDHFIVTDNKIALWESVSSFANLVELINVDHIIGTIGSNWGRLILELNLQKYPNGSRFPYFEVGENPCITPSQCRMCNRKISFSW
ncbi:Phosphatidylinositol 4-phosphate 5-kinase 4 [Histomonas meleagridis]|uniref:Phosphatidylinositol 4-phosphate 5-kinase 4 n=1 Tax=Histomonas meleagridis TaxID=135588 RepID=UPI003559AC7C|nr:Phosphatidylinositol 4-phosphate 5-kinase 4 [Histomonas meleagridis]KAH0796563.1 Phosphatidylinositol 4-phosphate 5-kinase 4 [Histomonas meleagridis]